MSFSGLQLSHAVYNKVSDTNWHVTCRENKYEIEVTKTGKIDLQIAMMVMEIFFRKGLGEFDSIVMDSQNIYLKLKKNTQVFKHSDEPKTHVNAKLLFNTTNTTFSITHASEVPSGFFSRMLQQFSNLK